MPAGVVAYEPISSGGNMNKKYIFDNEMGCLRNKNKKGEIVYCSASGCEAPASVLVGESKLPLCGVCADVWYMGFETGYDGAREEDKIVKRIQTISKSTKVKRKTK